MWTTITQNRIFQGALSGALAAAVVDFAAFRSWKNMSEAYAYDWPTAFWRWFQGAVAGAVTAAGLGLAA